MKERLLLVKKFMHWFQTTKLFQLKWLSECWERLFILGIPLRNISFWQVSLISLNKQKNLNKAAVKSRILSIAPQRIQQLKSKTIISHFSILIHTSKKILDLELSIHGIMIFFKKSLETILNLVLWLETNLLERLQPVKCSKINLIMWLLIWRQFKMEFERD